MATFGQGINPALGAINYTPYMQGVAQGSAAIGQGIASLGQDFAQGIQQYRQNKIMAGTATSEFEAAAQQSPRLLGSISSPSAPPEVAKAFKKLQKEGAVGLKDAAVLSTYAKTFVLGEQREQQAKMEMEQLRIARQNAKANMLSSQAQMEAAANRPTGIKPPEGYRYTQDGSLAPIPGGPQDPSAVGSSAWNIKTQREEDAAKSTEQSLKLVAEQKEKADKFAKRAATVKGDLHEMMDSVDRAIGLVKAGAGGPIAGTAPVRWAGAATGLGKAQTLNSYYDNIRANVKLEKMAMLKELSPTGSTGFGNQSDTEGRSLENSVAVLDPSLPEEVQLRNLYKTRDHIMRMGQLINQELTQSGLPILPSGWSVSGQ